MAFLQSLAFQTLLSVAFTVLVLALIFAVAWWATGKRSRPFDLQRTFAEFARRGQRRGSTDAAAAAATFGFVGRQREVQEFINLVASDRKASRVLVVTGRSGMGKSTLLNRFWAECMERRIPCGPVVDLSLTRSIEDLLTSVVSGLGESLDGSGEPSFKKFEVAFQNYRDIEKGRLSRLQEVTRVGGKIADTVPLPGGAATPVRAGTTIASALADQLASGRDMESALAEMQIAFLDGLLPLASKKPGVVLFFSDIDRHPDAPAANWLRTSLLPRLPQQPLLVVISSETQSKARLPASVAPIPIELGPLDQESSKQFIRDRLDIRDEAKVDLIARRASGIPQRLDNILRWWQELSPDDRDAAAVPTQLDAVASGGAAYEALRQIEDDSLRDVALAASALHWFNVPLLHRIAEVVNPTPDPECDVTRLITQSPAWVVDMGAGWGIQAERRQAFLSMLKRRDPDLYTRVHSAAAEYHHRRLVDYRPKRSAVTMAPVTDLFSDPGFSVDEIDLNDEGYETSLSEWLYHILNVDPDRAFPVVAEKAALLLLISSDHVSNVLGFTTGTTPSQREYFRLMNEAATALKGSQYALADLRLRDLIEIGSPTSLTFHSIQCMIGIVESQSGEESSAIEWIEKADRGLAALASSNPMAVRARIESALWLGWLIHRVKGDSSKALKLNRQTLKLAEELGNPSLIGEAHRVDGLILMETSQLAEAEGAFKRALELFRKATLTDNIASILESRATLRSKQGDLEGAEKDLVSAAEIYASLEKAEAEARVAVIGLGMYLERNRDAEAQVALDLALTKRPGDPDICNSIGLSFWRVNRWSEAAEHFLSAAKLAPGTRVYVENVAGALEQIGVTDPSGALSAALQATESVGPKAELMQAVSHIAQQLPAEDAIEILRPALARNNPALELLFATTLKRLTRPLQDTGELHMHRAPRPDSATAVGDSTAPNSSAEAMAHFTRAAELSRQSQLPAIERVRYILALAEAKTDQKQWDAASQLAGEALQLVPGDESAKALNTRLELRKAQDRVTTDKSSVCLMTPIKVLVPNSVVAMLEPPAGGFYDRMLPAMRSDASQRLGLLVPGVLVSLDPSLPDDQGLICLKHVPYFTFPVSQRLLAAMSPSDCAKAGVDCDPAKLPWSGEEGAWVAADNARRLIAAGISVWDVRGVMLESLAKVLERHFNLLVGVQEATEILTDPAQSDLLPQAAAEIRRRIQRHDLPIDADGVRAAVSARGAAEAAAASTPGFSPTQPAHVVLPESAPPSISSTTNGATGSGRRYTVDSLLGIANPNLVSISMKLTGGLDEKLVQSLAIQVLQVLCAALNLPLPDLQVTTEPGDGSHHALGIAIDGVLRFTSTLPPDGMSWWRQHPAAGSGGRTGADLVQAWQDSFRPEHAAVRALEEVMWADPSLLLPGMSFATDLAARRVPQPKQGVPTSGSERDFTILRPYEIKVQLAPDFYAYLGAARVEDIRFPSLRQELFDELGVAFPAFELESSSTLTPTSFCIWINGLPRARGTVPMPPPRRGTNQLPERPKFVNPFNGSLVDLLDVKAQTDTTGAAWALCEQLRASLREAAAEFTDFAWVTEQLDRVSSIYSHASVACVRARFADDTITQVCGELTRGKLTMRDFPLVLDSLSEVGLEGSESADLLTLVAHVRESMSPYVADRYAVPHAAQDRSLLNPIQRTLAGFKLLPDDEASIVKALPAGAGRDAARAAYKLILESVNRAIAARGGGANRVLVVQPTIRAQVQDAIAAQYPLIAVIGSNELGAPNLETTFAPPIEKQPAMPAV